MQKKRCANWKAGLAVLLSMHAALLHVQAKEIINCWDETKKAHYLRRKLSTAINIYAKEGTVPCVIHESGTRFGVEYDILTTDPSETTFLKVDYSEVPKYLDELYDKEMTEQGYMRVGGVNAGYFSNGSVEYGRPVGAVRTNNEWTTWQGKLNTPAYGNGFATAYFNTYDMTIKYHGWQNSRWKGDHNWSWWTGYLIDAENAISGSYTYFADGKETDVTNGDVGALNYHTYGRALTIFAQDEEGRFQLIEFYGTVPEDKVRAFLKERNVRDALRLDGGGSCQMIYDDSLVNRDFPKEPHGKDEPMFAMDALMKRREKK